MLGRALGQAPRGPYNANLDKGRRPESSVMAGGMVLKEVVHFLWIVDRHIVDNERANLGPLARNRLPSLAPASSYHWTGMIGREKLQVSVR